MIFVQTEHDDYFPQAIRNWTLEGIVCNISPARAFRYADNREGVMQNFVIVEELAKSLGAAMYQYKIRSWNVLVENLNMTKNRTYRFKYNLKPAFSKNVYPGQGLFEIHLTPYSSIVELAPETKRLVKNLCL